MDLRDFVAFARRFWLLILVCTAVGALSAVAYAGSRMPLYTSTSKVFVSTTAAATVADLTSGSTFSQQAVKSYAAVATTPYVLEPVIHSLRLTTTATALAQRMTANAPLDTTEIDIVVEDASATRAAVIANAVTERLTQAVSELSPTAKSDAAVRLTQIQTAVPGNAPTSPQWKLLVPGGAVGGLVVGLLLGLARRATDNRVRTKGELEHTTSMPVLGLTYWDPRMRGASNGGFLSSSARNSEAIRSLRTNLQFLGLPDAGNSFLITSSIDSEGKSTIAVDLARSLTAAGKHVVLLDADLRRPRIASLLSLEGGIGMSEVLSGQVDVGSATQAWSDDGLIVLPSGAIPPNPSELLQSARCKDLIAELESSYDYVLIDAPPLLPVADAAVLAQHVTGCLVVAAANRVKRAQAIAAVDVLRAVGATLFGTVLTMVRVKRGNDRYGYQYAYDSRSAAR